MEQAKPIMVVGATGFLGAEICRQLRAANKQVRALVRATSDPAKVQALHNLGFCRCRRWYFNRIINVIAAGG